MKKLSAVVLSLSAYLSIASPALAVSICPRQSPGGGGAGPFNFLCTLGLGPLIGAFVGLIFVIAIVAALLYLIWGGFKWLTSGGDKAAVQAAREHIVAAIVGLVLIFVTYVILGLLLTFFFGESVSLSNFTIPTLRP